MRIKVAIVLLTLLLVGSIVYANVGRDIQVQFLGTEGYIVGRDISFKDQPFIYEGKLYVPLEETAEFLSSVSYTDDGIPVLGRQIDVSLYELISEEVDGWISFENGIFWRRTIVGGEEYPFAYRKYMRGLYSNPMSITYSLKNRYSSFFGKLGIEDLSLVEDKPVIFKVYGDGVLLYDKTLEYGEDAVDFNIDITGIDALKLEMSATDDEKTGILALIDPRLKVIFELERVGRVNE